MKRLFCAKKDASITNAYANLGHERKVYANTGGSDIIETYVLYNRDGSGEYELSRFLVFFDLADIKNSLYNNGYLFAKYFLHLSNAEHGKTLPKEFDLELYPLTRDWEEGIGLDLENYSDEGGVSWKTYQTIPKTIPRITTYDWTIPGGDYDATKKKIVHFSEGDEDLRVDITDWVLMWLTESTSFQNFGIIVKFSDEAETSLQRNFYIKKFFARKSQFFYKRPYIEVFLEDSVNFNYNYDRLHFLKESDLYVVHQQYLYYFNRNPYGMLEDIPGFESNDRQLYVQIVTPRGEVIADEIRPDRIATGVYRYTVSIPKTVNYEYLFDSWRLYSNDERPFFTGKIIFEKSSEYSYNSYYMKNVVPVISVKNMKSSYNNRESSMFEVYAHDREWDPNVWVSYFRDQRRSQLKLKNTYYRVIRKIDSYIVVDYSIFDNVGVNYTKLYYNDEYNFFFFNFDILEPGFMYEFKFLSVLENGDYYEHPESFKFRVEEYKTFRF